MTQSRLSDARLAADLGMFSMFGRTGATQQGSPQEERQIIATYIANCMLLCIHSSERVKRIKATCSDDQKWLIVFQEKIKG